MIKVKSIVTESYHVEVVTLSDGAFELVCNTHERLYHCGSDFDSERWDIYANGVENIYRSDIRDFSVGQYQVGKKQFFNAKIIDVTQRIVQVGAYQIAIEEDVIPDDIFNGDFIEFEIDYLWIY